MHIEFDHDNQEGHYKSDFIDLGFIDPAQEEKRLTPHAENKHTLQRTMSELGNTKAGDANDYKILITDDRTAIDLLQNLKWLSATLSKTEGDLLPVTKQRRPYALTKINRVLLEAILDVFNKPGIAMLQRHFPQHTFNPWVETSIEHHDRVVKAYPYPLGTNLNSLLPGAAQDAIKMFVEGIRHDTKSTEFRERIKSFVRTARENTRSLNEYIDRLFERYARLLVVRLDLSYKKKREGWAGESDRVTPGDVQDHLRRFLRQLSTVKHFEHKVGYAWRLEYGLSKGYHIHCLILFDGSKVREDETLATLLGKAWLDVVGEGGLYWNCNAMKASYQECALGMVNHGDWTKIQYLKKAASYLTKPDHYLKLKKEFGRSFGKGELPPRGTARRGRPRSNDLAGTQALLPTEAEGLDLAEKMPASTPKT